MKSLPTLRRLCATLAAAAVVLLPAGPLAAQNASSVSAVPGQRIPVALPAPDKDGVHLPLEQAIAIFLDNNQDLNVTINAAEATQFQLTSAEGIFDPLLQGFANRNHQETPSSSSLSGAPLSVNQDTYNFGANVTQLAPWGGSFTLGTTGGRLATNSQFSTVNPSYNAGLQISMNQPLLRNAGYRTTTWLIRIAKDATERALLWKGRKGAFAAMGRVSPDYYVQDGVVPRTRLPEVLRRIAALGEDYGLRVGNVFHAGDGNLHPLVLYDAERGEAERAKELAEAILTACLDAGGSLTGEHGVGVDKACAMPQMFSERDLDAFGRLRRAFDPDGLANPGKVLPTPRLCGETPGPYRVHPLERVGHAERF